MLGLVNQDNIYLVSKLGSIQLKPVEREELIESQNGYLPFPSAENLCSDLQI